MKKIILLILLIVPIKVSALEIKAPSYILIDSSTNKIILENNSNAKLPPASMTKIALLSLIFERLDKNIINLDDEVTISEEAAKMGGSQVFLEANKKYKLETLIKSIAIASANDAAYAVSEYINPSVADTVKEMNELVKRLGLKNTHFENVHGLDTENHYSSAHDMAMLADNLLNYEKVLDYTKIYEDYVKHPNGNNTWIVNTNKLINYYEGLDGLKTGYTKNAGYCITATSKRNGMRLISVVMGETDNKTRNEDTIKLLNYGFLNFKLETILKKEELKEKINIPFSKKEEIDIYLKEEVSDLNNKIDKYNYSYEIEKYNLKAPLKKGSIVGKLKLHKNDLIIKEYDLIIKEEVKKANFFDLYIRNLRNFVNGIT